MDFGNGYLVIGGTSGNIAVSTNKGVSWSTAFQPGNGLSISWNVYGVAYWNGLWCLGNYASGGQCFSSGAPTSSSNFFQRNSGTADLIPNTSDLYAHNGLQVRNGRLFANKSSGTTLPIAWNS
jgi:hypothetical protein